jgi:hypothetical protein
MVWTMRAPQCGQVSVLAGSDRPWRHVAPWRAGFETGQYISYSIWKRTAASGAAWSRPASTAAL